MMEDKLAVDWNAVQESLNEKGYALLKNILTPIDCAALVADYDKKEGYRSIISMERYRFGKGEYKYFSYPLPPIVHHLREQFYTPLAHVANDWMQKLSIDTTYPLAHHELIEKCKAQNQHRPTPLILRYERGGFNTLHQDLYGEVYFPFQIVFALTQVGEDHAGGEFVLVQQIPRAQSKAEVVSLDKGDALIFTTNFRPVKGTKGYYRSTMKHGISEVKSGKRYSLGIIFHDAT